MVCYSSIIRHSFVSLSFLLILSVSFSVTVMAQEGMVNTTSSKKGKYKSAPILKWDKKKEEKETVKVPEKIEPLEPVETITGDPQVEAMIRRILIVKPLVDPSQIPSLFFTSWEQNLIEEARKGLVARPPTQSEVDRSQRELESGERPPMGPRELALGGIVYLSSGDWTVWLNGEKITPDAIPSEILDIRVYKNYIKLKWFDAYTNQIFPIKLRTHQRFNIDTRIFLPG